MISPTQWEFVVEKAAQMTTAMIGKENNSLNAEGAAILFKRFFAEIVATYPKDS